MSRTTMIEIKFIMNEFRRMMKSVQENLMSEKKKRKVKEMYSLHFT